MARRSGSRRLGGAVDPRVFSARISGIFAPTTSGVHRARIAAACHAKVFVDGHLAANAWDDWKKGHSFFEEGCEEGVGEVMLEAGRTSRIVIEVASKPSDNLGFSAVRFGIGLPMGVAEIAEAVRVAAAAERAIRFVGRSGEWDTEGSDLPGIGLSGRQEELIRAVLAANPRTVVKLQTGGPMQMPWLTAAPAVLQAWYPRTGGGQCDCRRAVRDGTGR